MKPTLILCALALFGLLTVIPAKAQDYIGLSASLTSLADADFDYGDIDDLNPNVIVDSSYKSGYGLSLLFGHRYNENIRIEGDISYRTNDFDEFGGSSGGIPEPTDPATGDIRTLSFILSGYYDVANPTRFTPYVGGGIGIANVAIDATLIDDPTDRNFDIKYDDNATAFAYQLGAGVSYVLTKLVTLDLGYRFFAVPNFELKDEDGDSFDSDYTAHNIALGMRLAF